MKTTNKQDKRVIEQENSKKGKDILTQKHAEAKAFIAKLDMQKLKAVLH